MPKRSRFDKNGKPGGPLPVDGKSSWIRRMVEEIRYDETILDMRINLAVLATYRDQLGERIEENDSPNLRTRALDLARDAQDGDEEALKKLVDLLERGVTWDSTWRKYIEMANMQLLAQAKAHEVMQKAQQLITPRRVVTMLASILDIIRDTCDLATARKLVQRIQGEVIGGEPQLALATGEENP